VAQHNVGSLRVLEKNGFVRVGEETLSLPDDTPLTEFAYVLRG